MSKSAMNTDMSYESILKQDMEEATQLVQQVVVGKISMEEFVKEYNNYYYCAALDGHEADDEQKKILQKYARGVEFHKEIQNVIDLLFFDSKNEKLYYKAGRIDSVEAKRRLANLTHMFKMELFTS